MRILDFEFPDDLLYDEERHLWVKKEGDEILVGVTSLGQYMAGKIFQISVKDEGEEVNPRSTVFSIESPKWVGKFRLPVEGRIVKVNKEVVENPSLINEKPYEAWIVRIKVTKFHKEFKTLKEVEEKFKQEVERVAR